MTVSRIQKLFALLHERFIGSSYLKYWLIALAIFFVLELVFKIMNGRHPRTLGRRTAIAALNAYVFLTYAYTVLCRETGVGYGIQLEPFWGYVLALQKNSLMQWFWIAVNLVMLAPVGFLLPCCFGKKMRWWVVLLIGAGFSYFIELSQLLLQKGNFELFDDPINNMIGCMAGFGIYCLFHHHREKQSEEV